MALGESNQSNELLFADPKFTPARRWIVEHGRGTFVAWLLRHPIDRVRQMMGDAWVALGIDRPRVYMPDGWSRGKRWLRGLFDTNRLVIGILFLVGAFALWPPRRHPLSWLGALLVVSGLVGCAASYYGDSIERARHCYGAGQQLLLGFVLSILGRTESILQTRHRGHQSVPPHGPVVA
jgi:hypothetical protein